MLKLHPSRIITMVALLLVVALVPANALAEQSLIAVQGLTGIEAQGYTRAGYYDLNNNWQSRSDVQQVSSSMSTFDGGWWVVDTDKTFSQRLEIKGDTNLILGGGHTLKVENGICINPGATLTIWTDTTNNENAGSLVASSGSFSGIGSNPKTVGGTLVINGGNIKATGGNKSAGIGGSEEGRLTSITINKGYVEARGGQGGAGIGSGYKADSCPVNINGGEVKANGGRYGAGIGGGQRVDKIGGFGGGCTINGGTVTAMGGEHGAGIGGGAGISSSGDSFGRPTHDSMTGSGGVTITAGTVTATGGASGAGIGGGMRGYADGLTFSGGTVIATAGELAAGIGGGQFGESTEITIDGGNVTAKACDNKKRMEHRYSGAAIGSGWRADFKSKMVVNGGKVTAIGAIGGAGIGAGSQGNMTGTLTVTGGEVYAYGGRSGYTGVSADANRGGAGIGGGEEVKYNIGGEGGTVDIQGGKVVACAGGGWHCAIGHGYNDSVMGNLSIADSMWVRWTNTLTRSGAQSDGTYNEPTVDPASLTPAWTPNRVSDCRHMRYVVIEKCPHNAPSVSYIDTAVFEHTLSSDCPYCGAGHAGAVADHEFDPTTHTCICGHKERAVTFYDENGGVYVATDYYVEGTTIKRPDNPAPREGFTFLGWFRETGENQLATKPYNFSLPVGNSDIKLHARWSENVVNPTVRFYNDNAVIRTETVQYGQKATMPADPTRDGCSFLGWFMELEDDTIAEWDFDDAVESDLDLHAYWSEETYEVTFNKMDHGNDIDAQQVSKGGKVDTTNIIPTLSSAEEGKWLFKGWYTDSGCTKPYDFSSLVTDDVALYAKWEPIAESTNVYVTFDPNGGTLADGAVARQAVAKGEAVAKPAEPTREGYRFLGWYVDPGDDPSAEWDFAEVVNEDITLVAAWEDMALTVDFDAAGGSPTPGSQSIRSGGKVTEPADPTRDGYVFLGWFCEELEDIDDPDYIDEIVRWDFEDFQVFESLTLTAHWKTNKHVVTFDPANGSDATTQEVADGQTATRPADPTRAGYSFAGWYLDGSTYNFDAQVNSDLTLTARWSKLCTVRFDTAGGAPVPPPLQVNSGTKLTKPANPVREGCTFQGWYMDLEDGTSAEWNFDEDMVEDDLVLEARWLVKTHTVRFDTQGGSAVAAQDVDDGARVRKSELAEPTKDGFIFAGWFTTSAGTLPYDFSTPVKSDITLYAKWVARTASTYALTFDSDGGNYIEPQQLAEGVATLVPQAPKREGYEFADWYEVSEGRMLAAPFEFGKPIEHDTVLRAAWIPLVVHRVDFDLDYENSGRFIPESQDVADGGFAQQPPEPVREGYLFAGWYQKDENETLFSNPYAFDSPVTQDIVLYADWLGIKEAYSVTFDSLGGTKVAAQNVKAGSKASKPADPTRGGYKFAGWFTSAKFVKAYSFDTSVKKDYTLYAKWTTVHRVTFDAAGGTKVAAQSVDDGNKASKPSDPTRSGYKFLGWYADAKLAKAYDFSAPVNGDLTVYAKWLKVHSVSFDTAGGTKVAAQNVDDGNKASKPSNPTRSGYKFLGWYADAKLSQAYDFSAPVKQDLTVYAKWVKVHRVSFDSKGGSKVGAQSVDDGKKASKPSDPKRSGYKFAGWYGNAKLTKPYDFSAKVTSDLALYAKWLKIHRVSFDSAGGTKVGAQRVVNGKKASRPSDPTRKGYRFLGWYSNAKLTKAYDFSAPVKKSLTLHAKWQAEKAAPKNLLLKLRGTPGETSVTLLWDKVDGARSYVVYGTKCGKSAYHKIKVLPGSRGTATLKKVDGKKLKRGTYYKFYVLAKSGKAGKGKVLSESRRAHVATRGGRVGNFRKVTVNVPGKKLTLRVGESFQLEARAIPEGGGLKSHTHRKMPFESSNAKVAKVRASGEIIARAKGTAYVYAYAQNGVAARVKVTVK